MLLAFSSFLIFDVALISFTETLPNLLNGPSVMHLVQSDKFQSMFRCRSLKVFRMGQKDNKSHTQEEKLNSTEKKKNIK